jgi:hypothetical protein
MLFPAMSADLALREQVEVLHQQAVASGGEFCIDLEGQAPDGKPVWQWAGYARKDSATRAVESSGLADGVDYRSTEVWSGPENGKGGGHNRRVILFSRDGFKQWLMLARTDRGREVRLYFIDVEKRYQRELGQVTPLEATVNRFAEFVQQGFSSVHGAMEEVRSEVRDMRADVEMLKEQQLYRLYVFVRMSDQTVKIGVTNDFQARRKVHEKRGFQFVAETAGNPSQETRIKQALRRAGHEPKNGDEEYQLSPALISELKAQGLPVGNLMGLPKGRGKKERVDCGTISLPLF